MSQKRPGFGKWRSELAPFAPCRRPGCAGVVRWRGLDSWDRHNGETEQLFCTTECEDAFWATRETHRQALDGLIAARREAPDFWMDHADTWDEQYHLAWWHLARYMGVRRFATDPDRAKWHEHYYAVGQMISRAGEWETQAETTLALLLDEPPARYRRLGADAVVKKLRASAPRWPHIEARVNDLCDAAAPALDHRNWLVHSWVTPSWTGDVLDLRKPIKNQHAAGQRTASVEQTQRVAARFVWLINATTRVVAYMHADEPGPVTVPLGPPPPIDYELTDEQLFEALRAKRMRERLDLMSGDHGAETELALADLRVTASELLAASGQPPDSKSRAVSRFVKGVSEGGLSGLVAAAVLCASTCVMSAEDLDISEMEMAEGLHIPGAVRPDLGTTHTVVQAYLRNEPAVARQALAQALQRGVESELAQHFAEAITHCIKTSAEFTRTGSQVVGEKFARDFFDGLGA